MYPVLVVIPRGDTRHLGTPNRERRTGTLTGLVERFTGRGRYPCLGPESLSLLVGPGVFPIQSRLGRGGPELIGTALVPAGLGGGPGKDQDVYLVLQRMEDEGLRVGRGVGVT